MVTGETGDFTQNPWPQEHPGTGNPRSLIHATVKAGSTNH